MHDLCRTVCLDHSRQLAIHWSNENFPMLVLKQTVVHDYCMCFSSMRVWQNQVHIALAIHRYPDAVSICCSSGFDDIVMLEGSQVGKNFDVSWRWSSRPWILTNQQRMFLGTKALERISPRIKAANSSTRSVWSMGGQWEYSRSWPSYQETAACSSRRIQFPLATTRRWWWRYHRCWWSGYE